MAGAQGNALEWALALLRAPGERHGLRQRPLPEGIEALLAIAAGASAEDLAAAAARLREPPEVVREAARFYVREVLFHPHADAYRVLGVASDASAATIKAHHRLLQHWLHPDRLQSQDDSVFAGRVNTAWNHLRSDARRRAYDEEQARLVPQDRAEPQAVLRPLATWTPVEAPPRWRHRLPVLALGATCLVLVGLIAIDADRAPPTMDAPLLEAGRVGEREPESFAISQPVAALGQGDQTAGQAASRAKSPPPGAAPNTARRPQAPTKAAPPQVAAKAASVQRVAVQRPSVQGPLKPAPKAANAATARRSPAPAPRAIVAAEPASRGVASVRVRGAAHAPAGNPPAPAVTPVPQPAQASGAVAEAGHVRQREAEVVQAARPASPAVKPDDAPGPPNATPPSLARIRQADATAALLLRYMTDTRRPSPPIWNSPGIQSSAEQLRQHMLGAGPARVQAPTWRIGQDDAWMVAQYTPRKGATGSGRLSANLVWREGQWLVTGLSVESAP